MHIFFSNTGISETYMTLLFRWKWQKLILIDLCHKSFRELDMFSIVDTKGAETRAMHSSTPKFVSTIENMSRSLNNTYLFLEWIEKGLVKSWVPYIPWLVHMCDMVSL
jgi:hypothetical protein